MSSLSPAQKRTLVACVVGAAFGYGTLGIAVFGQFAGPLGRLTHQTPQRVALAFSAMTLGSLIAPPIAGALIDRCGARRVAVTSALLMAGTFVLLGLVRSIGVAYLLYAAVALSGAGTLATAYSRPIIAHFDENRGAALGLMLSAIGLGAAALPPVLNAMIDEYGLAAGYWTLAVVAVLAVVPTAFLMPETRQMAGRDTMTARTLAPLLTEVFSSVGIKMVAIALLLGLFSAGVWSQAVPLLIARGLTGAQAAWTMTGVALIMAITRLLAGFAMDRFFAPAVGILLLVPVSLAWFALGTFESSVITVLSVLTFGLGQGAEFDLFSYLTSKYVPQAIYASFYGVLYSALAVGLSSGAPIFAYLGPSGPFAVGIACAATIAVLLTMPRYPMPAAAAIPALVVAPSR